jgi:hypothetical protein
LLPNEIRVARCKFVGESTFTIVLQKVNLDNGPDFDALSYAWGDREEGALIRAADRPTGVEINPNLLSAMKHTWSLSPDRAIWIDALCINQQNQQVSLMTRIYRQAKQVLVWLGGEDDISSSAFEFLAACTRIAQKAYTSSIESGYFFAFRQRGYHLSEHMHAVGFTVETSALGPIMDNSRAGSRRGR